MLKFQYNHRYPDYISKERLHIITTKNTIFGVHNLTYEKDLDPSCTRTNLVSFVREEDAKNFRTSLEQFQIIRKQVPDRVIDGSDDTFRKTGSLMTFHVDSIDANDIESLCRIHGFNMLVVHHVHTSDELMRDIFECYLYESPLPSPSLLAKYFKDMYRKT